jgi:hypothetical protein
MSDRLNELRAQRAALEASRAARAEAEAEASAIAAEERAIAEEQAIVDAETKYGRLGEGFQVFATAAGRMLVKRAPSLRMRNYLDEKDSKYDDVLAFVRQQIIYPSLAVFDAAVDQYPAIALQGANALAELAGFRKELLGKG